MPQQEAKRAAVEKKLAQEIPPNLPDAEPAERPNPNTIPGAKKPKKLRNFYLSDNVSRLMPGKEADFIVVRKPTKPKTRHQKRHNGQDCWRGVADV